MRTLRFSLVLALAGCSAASDFDYSFRPSQSRDSGVDGAQTSDAAHDLDALASGDSQSGDEPPLSQTDAANEDASCGEAGCCELLETSERSCDSTRDEDCDGKVDCADSDCRQAANCCPNPTIESGEAACTDGVDNDCDGLLDCAEQGCTAIYECTCTPSGAEDNSSPASCLDGNDNDCDRLTDCEEKVGCAFASVCCTPTAARESGAACTDGINNDCDADGVDCADPDCRMSNDAGATSDEAMQCADDSDNDCDGQVDCEDSDCRTSLDCCTRSPGQEQVETACGDGINNDCDQAGEDCFDNDCALAPGCCRPVKGGETSAALCRNGKDDDCDGDVDCSDPQCSGFRDCCIEHLRANGQKLQTTETSCGDKFDNDCDGLLNCADPDCPLIGPRPCGIIVAPAEALSSPGASSSAR